MADIITKTGETRNTRIDALIRTTGAVYGVRIINSVAGIDTTVQYTYPGGTAWDLYTGIADAINNDPDASSIVVATAIREEDTTSGNGALDVKADVSTPFVLETLQEPVSGDDVLKVVYYEPEVPRWATDNTALIVEPDETKKDIGWEILNGTEGERPPLEYFNWFWNIVGNWFTYLRDVTDRLLKIEDGLEETLARVPYTFPVQVTMGWIDVTSDFDIGYNSIPIYTDGPLIFAEIRVNPQPITNDTALSITLDVPSSSTPVTPPTANGKYTPCIYYCNADGSPIGNGALPLWPSDEPASTDVTNTVFWNSKLITVHDDLRWAVGYTVPHTSHMNHGRVILKQLLNDINTTQPTNGLIYVQSDEFPTWQGVDGPDTHTTPTIHNCQGLIWGVPVSLPVVPVP